MDRAAYDRYVERFNARDYDAVLAHFADAFELVFAGHVFRTKDEVRRFYEFLHRHLIETITVQAFVSNESMVAMEADVRLEGLEDITPEALVEQGLEGLVPLRKGEVIIIPQFIHYHLSDGKIVRALCAVFEPPSRPVG
jgi:SnoaL-like domain